MPRFAGVVLAAGRSTRFGGGSKLLEHFAGRAMALHPVFAAHEAGLSPVVVTIGAESDEVASLIAGEAPFAELVRIAAPQAGMSDSLRAGLAKLGGVDGAAILLADMPLVDASLIIKLADAWRPGDAAVAPVYQGQRGHPVLLSAGRFDLAQIARGDRGLGAALETGENIRLVSVDSAACLLDIDTRADLKLARAAVPRG
jgi:molybdenum cofactor cytidylyltransferase